MDEAYKQHSHHARRKNRSSTNLNHLTLAPLTTKLPLDDEAYVPTDDEYQPPSRPSSYIQDRSTPTTPGLFTRSPTHSRTRSRHRASAPSAQLLKSKSASHLAAPDDRASHVRKAVSGTTTPTHTTRRRAEPTLPHNDSDWFLRAGVLMSTEAREYKGQTWLTSRASSTSLSGLHDAEEDALERELARDRELIARHESRRGSTADFGEAYRSARGSRVGSRSASRVGNRSQMMTPLDGCHQNDGYFGRATEADEHLRGPDFINVDEELEALGRDSSQEDEAVIRKLVKGERQGGGSWFGWSLFSVEENQEDSDVASVSSTAEADDVRPRKSSSSRHLEGVIGTPGEHIRPPHPDQGGWRDAAWLLSVASKVIL